MGNCGKVQKNILLATRRSNQQCLILLYSVFFSLYFFLWHKSMVYPTLRKVQKLLLNQRYPLEGKNKGTGVKLVLLATALQLHALPSHLITLRNLNPLGVLSSEMCFNYWGDLTSTRVVSTIISLCLPADLLIIN